MRPGIFALSGQIGERAYIAVPGGLPSGVKAAQDQAAAIHSLAASAAAVPSLPWDYNQRPLFLEYGQSLAQGGIAHPPKTLAAPPWAITAHMLGSSVRAAREHNEFFPFGGIGTPSPAGAKTLQTLVATMDIDNQNSGNRYDPATFAGRTPTSGINGEASVVGLVYDYYRRMQATVPETKNAIAAVHGFGGMILRDLMDDDGERYAIFAPKYRTQSYLSALTSALGPATFNFFAVSGDQGQAEAQQTGSTDWQTYDARLAEFMNFVSLLMSPWGQTSIPPVLWTQTGGKWGALGTPASRAVPQFQHRFAVGEPCFWLCSLAHAVPQKMNIPGEGLPVTVNGHLDGNATRWQAAYKAKVLARLRSGRNFEHVHVIAATCRGREVILSFNLPVPPLTIRDAFMGYRRTRTEDLGYSFADTLGDIPVLAAQPHGTHSVVFFLLRAPAGAMTYQAGAKGYTNIADSDPAVSNFKYQHDRMDFSTAKPSPNVPTAQEDLIEADVLANLGSLDNLSYPLPNFAVLENGNVTVL